jgi:hypothetical protein
MDSASAWPIRQIRRNKRENAANNFSCQNKNTGESMGCTTILRNHAAMQQFSG